MNWWGYPAAAAMDVGGGAAEGATAAADEAAREVHPVAAVGEATRAASAEELLHRNHLLSGC